MAHRLDKGNLVAISVCSIERFGRRPGGTREPNSLSGAPGDQIRPGHSSSRSAWPVALRHPHLLRIRADEDLLGPDPYGAAKMKP